MPSLPAVFVRGGTSKGLVFHSRDLPAEPSEQDAIFLRAMGSPDPYGRQLDGMGGGLSSLSKVCVVGPPTRPDADVDYLFAQVQIASPVVTRTGNCGNMSAAIGPFAVEEGLVPKPSDGKTTVRIHNANTRKLIHATFAVRGGSSVVAGDYTLPGVAGTASPVRLDFLDPGGSATGSLLPCGPWTMLTTGGRRVRVSMVDAANPVVFVHAADVGLTATESPAELEAAMPTLEAIRRESALRMGIAANASTPFVAVVGPPAEFVTTGGQRIGEADVDLSVRFLSNGQPHRTLPLTGALCTAVAARVPGTVVHDCARAGEGTVRLGSPAGPIEAAAAVDGSRAVSATAYRTTRRLFTGRVEL
jgi:2-methylaconitate isomerase